MKKLRIFIFTIITMLFIPVVSALSFDKTNEISWDFSDTAGDTSSNTIKVEDGYIYTERYNKDGTYGVKIIKRNTKGTIVWSNSIDNDCSHDIAMIGENVYYTNSCYGMVKIDSKSGSTIKNNVEAIGYDIKEINDNLIIFEDELLTIVNQDLEVLYKLEASKINTSYTDIMYLDYYVEDNKIYALVYIEDTNTHWVVTINKKLEIEKRTQITYDENQGFLSEEDGFEDLYSFVKYGNDFYQIGEDIYKISSSGKATLLLEDDYENDYCQFRNAYDAIVVDDYLVTLEEIWDDCEEVSQIRYTIYDETFNEISSVKINSLGEKPYTWSYSLSKTNNGFIVRWFDEYDSYNSNITEYSINNPTCKVISGTGKNIGDELQCGTENFYVLSNDGKKVKMLAKYNLYAGFDYYKIDFGQTFETYNEAQTYYNNNYASEYTNSAKFLTKDNAYYGVIAYKEISREKILQNEIAIGAHGNLKVEPEFPELGVYPYYWEVWDEYLYETEENIYDLGYQDVLINSYSTANADWLYVLEAYEKELAKQNVTSENVSIISVAELNELVLKVTGKELPLEDWYNDKANWGNSNSSLTLTNNDSYIVGSIKDLMPKGYEWLWGTTYWTRTLDSKDNDNLYFVDTMGDLCSGDYCDDSIGAGLRPVVTISIDEIKYEVKTKTDGNGTVEATHVEAKNGDQVKFTVTAKKGYDLKEIKVTDEEGNIVTFTDYTFVMPSANVTIEATFTKVDNPNTFALSIFTSAIVGIIAFIIAKKQSKKLEWLGN